MTAGTSVLGFNASQMMPNPPERGSSDRETISNLLEYIERQNQALRKVFRQMNSKAEVGFTSYNNGTTTVYSTDDTGLTVVPGTIDFDLPLMSGFTWSVDGGIPKWTTGTITYAGTDYTIPAWSSGDSDSDTKSINWNLSSPSVFSEQETPTSAKDRWHLAFFDGTAIYPAFQSTIIHGGLIQSDTVTATEINTTDLFAQRLIISASGSIENGKGSYPDASVAGFWFGDVSGTPKFRFGTSTDYMDYDGSSFTIEGGITISGTTTFSAGYDPTDKVADEGGTYTSATGSVAKVEIFPDSSTGIVAYTTGAASEVFRVNVGGTDVGDVVLGDYTGGNGCLWDDSLSTFTVKGTLDATDLTVGTLSVDRIATGDIDQIKLGTDMDLFGGGTATTFATGLVTLTGGTLSGGIYSNATGATKTINLTHDALVLVHATCFVRKLTGTDKIGFALAYDTNSGAAYSAMTQGTEMFHDTTTGMWQSSSCELWRVQATGNHTFKLWALQDATSSMAIGQSQITVTVLPEGVIS